jgi:hypothetical protein
MSILRFRLLVAPSLLPRRYARGKRGNEKNIPKGRLPDKPDAQKRGDCPHHLRRLIGELCVNSQPASLQRHSCGDANV